MSTVIMAPLLNQVWKERTDSMQGLFPVKRKECFGGQVFYPSFSLNNKEINNRWESESDPLPNPGKVPLWSFMISNIPQMKGHHKILAEKILNVFSHTVGSLFTLMLFL